MEKIATCQISFTPIVSTNYIEDINKVLDIIKSYEVDYNVGMMSTTIKGNKETLLKIINQIFNTMYEVCSFTMDVKLSNVCGCNN
ncbi:YkoF family thiamine/hydroxymethylpyrimidine-binding protein [Abyssisolibacter fermentans]|uniref:YkoF family thiamine/hydroxymethylpyrimidine-binding protein n=1 Tax=Abyssisolibacter fermentans TaxID=1766203 RepID=UPI00138F9632|nr:YkoF family thiamine/hydroxymethylpyrimidine-binding protein [Abyssisolibacter fermentans]